MRIAWDSHRDSVIGAARESRSLAELVSKVVAFAGPGATEDAIRGAWRRWQARWPEIPDLSVMLGAGIATDDTPPPAELLSMPARTAEGTDPGFVYPKGMKPSAEPPLDETTVVDPGELPRFVLADGDLHYSIHDRYVEAAKLAFARDIKPDAWVNVGDVYDCWLISRYEKEPERLFDAGARLQEEFDSARPYWSEVSRIVKRAHLILGNHENRLERLVSANPGLFGLRALEWHRLAELPANVRVHAYGKRLRIGSMTFEHGDRMGGRFGVKHPTAWLLDNRGARNTVFGHTHRVATTYRTVWDEDGNPHTYVAINQGHGSDVAKQTYQPEANWQHGFTLIENYTEAGKPRFTAHVIPIVNGKFSWGGRVYDGRKCQ